MRALLRCALMELTDEFAVMITGLSKKSAWSAGSWDYPQVH